MKIKLLFLFCVLLAAQFGFSQCVQADPFCTGTNYSFPNNTNVTDLGAIDCLGSTPNPVWYFMEIDQNGPMTITMNQVNTSGTGIDVDFALWGPYTSLAAGCGAGTFPAGSAVDCSYSTAASETATIPNATIGQFYILLLTNYANQAGTISFSQTGGTGSADCSFVCGVTGFTAIPSACNPATNTYSVSGNLGITNPPTTGTLTITSSCGGSQTFNAPFATSINYNLTGLVSNGANCTVSTSFSANANCNTSQNYVAPPACTTTNPCNFGNFTGSITNCDIATNTYTITGTINYTFPPSSGTLTLTNSCGGTQVFNAPFGSASNFSMTGTANGSNCVISAAFSADPSCTATLAYPTPPACNCNAMMGTFTTTLLPMPAINKICYNDQFSITSNQNFSVPDEIIGATNPASPNYDPTAPIYDPGVVWLAYSCPPTVSLTPIQSNASGLTIPDDPCLVSVVTSTEDISDLNDLSFINSFPVGTFTDNVVYYVPLTMYSIQTGTYSYVTLPALDCFDLGDPIAVQYLPQITSTYTSNCANGTATVTLTGSSPSLNGGNFTGTPGSILPTGATYVTSTAPNNGNIVIGNLGVSGPFSFSVTDIAGCSYNFAGNYVGGEPAGITYPDNTYCLTDPNPIATISGTLGGTVTSGPGLSINATTGNVNLSNSSTGTYLITYTTAAQICPGIATFNLTISPDPVVDAGPDKTVCFGNPIILQATGASTYSWDQQVLNGMSYLPPAGENDYVVIGTNSAGCTDQDSVHVTVVEDCISGEVIYWVPNTFTPDGDQFNQTFKPVLYSGYDPYEYDFFIFDRWGELIWESHNASVGWDGSYHEGRKCPDGVYTWKMNLKTMNNDEKIQVLGHVTLIR